MTTNNDKALTVNVAAPSGAIIPRTIDEVARLARMAAASGLAKTTSPEAAGMLICAGLEIGLTPMQALLGMHMVEGRPTLAADTIVALVVRRTDVCEYWRSIESTAERHTIETKRRGEAFQPVRRTWTMDDARRAGLAGKAIWQRYPADMLRHRCATALAREVFPDVIAGMAYTREEIGDGLHRGDEEPQHGIDLSDPTGSTIIATAVVATPAPLALPGDHGPSPSEASAAPAASSALKDAEEQVRNAATVDAVALAYVAAKDDLAPDAKGRLWRVARARAADLGATDDALKAACLRHSAPVAPPPPAANDGDEPPPSDGPPRPRSGRKGAPKGDAPAATGGGLEGAPAGQDGAAAWWRSEAETIAHAAALRGVEHLEASARRHGRDLGPTPWGLRVYAARYAAMEPANAGHAEGIVARWMASGPKASAAAQRKAEAA